MLAAPTTSRVATVTPAAEECAGEVRAGHAVENDREAHCKSLQAGVQRPKYFDKLSFAKPRGPICQGCGVELSCGARRGVCWIH